VDVVVEAGVPSTELAEWDRGVAARTRELVEFARRQGYHPHELVRIIEELG
jgi:hypothetical protein